MSRDEDYMGDSKEVYEAGDMYATLYGAMLIGGVCAAVGIGLWAAMW